VPGPADACCHVWCPFPSDSGEVVDIVGGERKWIGNAELSRIMTVEVVTRAPAHGSACIYLQRKAITFMAGGSRNSGEQGNFRAARPCARRSGSLRKKNAS